MAGSSIRPRARSLVLPARERAALRHRVGAFLRSRREELGLTMGDVIRALGYQNMASVWKLETGREGLPAKRVYAWADLLQVPRDRFFSFVVGETDEVPGRSRATPADAAAHLSAAEADLVAAYRRLPPRYQRRLRETVKEFETLAGRRKTARQRGG